MYKKDYQNGLIDSLHSKHRNTSLEDDFEVHLMKSEGFYRNTIDDDYEVEEEEEGFTDLRICEEPVGSDSGRNRSYQINDLSSNHRIISIKFTSCDWRRSTKKDFLFIIFRTKSIRNKCMCWNYI